MDHLPLREKPGRRRAQILDLVSRNGQISVRDLAEQLGTSQVTIRSDLVALSEQGLLIRTHGGARACESGQELPPGFLFRVRRYAEQKQRIGAAAAAMVHDHEAIILDASTSALAIAPYLAGRHELTVATYSLAVANALLGAPSVNILMLGGFLNRNTCALLGDETTPELLKRFSFQTSFFGASGFSLDHGLTEAIPEEAKIKKLLAAHTRYVCAVIDSSKWNRVSVAPATPLGRIDCVITDDQAPVDMVAAVREAGIQVIIA